MSKFFLHLGDCLETMRGMAPDSVDAVVTDPPYGLSQHKTDEVVECMRAWLAGEVYQPKGAGFMGKNWDAWVPGPEVWREVLRVLKPGGHVLAFAGTRSMDLMSIAIRLAGFELRDAVGRAHDGIDAPLMAWVYGSGMAMGSVNVAKAIDKEDLGDSAQWDGWGTRLKPAWEPIIMARKPLVGTVAGNVVTHGTGGINIDACRVEASDALGGTYTVKRFASGASVNADGKWKSDETYTGETPPGRYPANVIHDGSPDVLAGFPVADSGSASRFFYCAKASKKDRDEGMTGDARPIVTFQTGNGASGKASSMSEGRNTEYRNIHPTVKPHDLMSYLCRLITPPGRIILDPFTGSGSTGKAAIASGFRFVGCEMDPEYLDIARARIQHECDLLDAETAVPATPPRQPDLFEAAS